MSLHRNLLYLLAALALAVALSFGGAQAQNRYVAVNGVVLNSAELYELDQRAGGYVPNGAYWLNLQTGVWGFAGNPRPQGQLGGFQYDAGPSNLYGADGPGYNRRAAGGDMLSDGSCAFIVGVPVGDC